MIQRAARTTLNRRTVEYDGSGGGDDGDTMAEFLSQTINNSRLQFGLIFNQSQPKIPSPPKRIQMHTIHHRFRAKYSSHDKTRMQTKIYEIYEIYEK